MEIQDISSTLTSIRKTHDKYCRKYLTREQEIAQMRHRINKTKIFQDKILLDTATLDERLEVLRKKMSTT